jgi:integrase
MRSPLHTILARANFSPRTKTSYARVIEQWLEFAGHDPKGWTRPRAQAFYDEMLTRGVSSDSANVYIASLRYVSKWYAIQENRPELDFALVQQREPIKHVEGKIQRALTKGEAQGLLATCAGDRPIDQRDRTLIVVGLETGMRRMSLAGMRLENLSTQNGYPVAKVPIKGAGGDLMFPVPLSSTASRMIENWRGWLRKQGMRQGAVFTGFHKRIGSKGRNTYEPTGEISLPAIYKILTRRAETAGIKGMHPHLLRHTFVTWRQDAGLSAIQIASITGHKTLGIEWANMQPYLDLKMIAELARESTPIWLIEFVNNLQKGPS